MLRSGARVDAGPGDDELHEPGRRLVCGAGDDVVETARLLPGGCGECGSIDTSVAARAVAAHGRRAGGGLPFGEELSGIFDLGDGNDRLSFPPGPVDNAVPTFAGGAGDDEIAGIGYLEGGAGDDRLTGTDGDEDSTAVPAPMSSAGSAATTA